MRRNEIEDDLPLVILHYDTIVRGLDARRSAVSDKRKVSRRVVINTYLQTHSLRRTAALCGVSVTTVNVILAKAIFKARRLSGLPIVPSMDNH